MYDKFGRFMVSAETKIHELDRAGLLKEAFSPYHYCRQCLKHSYLHLEKARAASLANPEETLMRQAAARLEKQAEIDRLREEASIDGLIRDQQAASEAKHAFSKSDDKSVKFRQRERRAGRVFTSVEHTKKAASTRTGAFRTGPSNLSRGASRSGSPRSTR
jgi:hypothetical protein